MKLPQINPSRLQRVVADLEFTNNYASFDDLCEAIGQTDWAQRFELDSQVIGRLIVHHGTITKVEKPAKLEEPLPEPATSGQVNTFDEGGRGRKQCPSCTKYVGVRNARCACGYQFSEKAERAEKPTEPIKVYDEGGRGKKQCPSCLKYVGARNTHCACGHEFSRETAIEPARPRVPERKPREVTVVSPVVRGQGYRRTTYVPSGACPHRLTGTDATSVAEWAERVRNTYGQQQEAFLTLAGLKYWARDFYDIFSREYDEVASQLELLDTPL